MLDKDARELFNNDSVFNKLVHTMADLLKGGDLSIPELRASVSLAANLYSYTEPSSRAKVLVPMKSGIIVVDGSNGYRAIVKFDSDTYSLIDGSYPTKDEAKEAATKYMVDSIASGKNDT